MGPHSVDEDSAWASATRAFLAALASWCSFSRLWKWLRRARSNVERAALICFHSSCSKARSWRGMLFHSSTMARNLSLVLRQAVDSANDSALATRSRRFCSASALAAALSSARVSRRTPTATSSWRTRAARSARSPTTFGSSSASRMRSTVRCASSGDIRPSVKRRPARSTSTTRSS